MEDPNLPIKTSSSNTEELLLNIFLKPSTNLETKEGLGYSGTATESGMAAYDVVEDISYVSYLYKLASL